MIPILIENTPLIIHVSSDSELTKSVINYTLQSARALRRYAKFYSNKYYIEVTFQRDGTINIATNYRFNSYFNKCISKLEERPFKLSDYVNFIWLWMNRIRKLK